MNIVIVGNSSSVINFNHGKTIDLADTVMRFNMAETYGFEKHVGSITDIRIINTHLFECMYDDRSHLDMSDRFGRWGQDTWRTWNKEKIWINGPSTVVDKAEWLWKILNRHNTITYIDSNLVKRATKLLKQPATSGFLGIYWAIQSGYTPKCYGFDYEGYTHYFESVKPYNMTKFHDFIAERNQIQQWYNEGKIKWIC